jgi:hypothetical protein
MSIDLIVDYEDQADWLQDSVVLLDVDLGEFTCSHEQLLNDMSDMVYEATREMNSPPTEHIKIMGYSPANSDVVVKRGVNYWTSPDNIFSN